MKVLVFFGWVTVGYIALFIVVFFLYMGCVQDGHSSRECKDNFLSQVVIAPINVFK